MINAIEPHCIGLCEVQPVTVEGIRHVLDETKDLRLAAAYDSLPLLSDFVSRYKPKLVLLDKSFGLQALYDWMLRLRELESGTKPIVWGASLSESEALRLLQAGARGILRKTAPISSLLGCLRAVAAGATWMEDSVFREANREPRYQRSDLTARERQVMELVEQGLKNREIGRQLGIRPGTVKIHLKHIFEKTGVRGRYGLALNGLKDRGLVSALPM